MKEKGIISNDFNEKEFNITPNKQKKKNKIIICAVILVCLICVILSCVFSNSNSDKTIVTTTHMSEWSDVYDITSSSENEEKYPDQSLPALKLN